MIMKNGVMMKMMILELIGWIFLLAICISNFIYIRKEGEE
jgi:hypothetical protein